MNEQASRSPESHSTTSTNGGGGLFEGVGIGFPSSATWLHGLRPHPSSRFASQVAGRASGLMTSLSKHIGFDAPTHPPDRLPIWKPGNMISAAASWAEAVAAPFYGLFNLLRSRFEKNAGPGETNRRFNWTYSPEMLRGKLLNLLARRSGEALASIPHPTYAFPYEVDTESESDGNHDVTPEIDEESADGGATGTVPAEADRRVRSGVFPPMHLTLASMIRSLRGHLGVAEPRPASPTISAFGPPSLGQTSHWTQQGHDIGEPSAPASHHLGVQTMNEATSPPERSSYVVPLPTAASMSGFQAIQAVRGSPPSDRSFGQPAQLGHDVAVSWPIQAERGSTPSGQSVGRPAQSGHDLAAAQTIQAKRGLTTGDQYPKGSADELPDLPVFRVIPSATSASSIEALPTGSIEGPRASSIHSPEQDRNALIPCEGRDSHLVHSEGGGLEAGTTLSRAPLPHPMHLHGMTAGVKPIAWQDESNADGSAGEATPGPFPLRSHLHTREQRRSPAGLSGPSQPAVSELTSDIPSFAAAEVEEERAHVAIGVPSEPTERISRLVDDQPTDLWGNSQSGELSPRRYALLYPAARMVQRSADFQTLRDRIASRFAGSQPTDWEHDVHPFEFLTHTHDSGVAASRRTAEERLPLAIGGLSRRSDESEPIVARAPLGRANATSADSASANSTSPLPSGRGVTEQIDVDSLAREVYRIIRRRLYVEKERCAFGS